jgi:hypothetical protein
MSEYAAAAVIFVGGIFYLLDLAFRLSDRYAGLKPFLVGASFWLGAVAMNYAFMAVEQVNPSLSVVLGPAYYLWIVTGIVIFSYMVIMLIIQGYNAIQKKKDKVVFDDDS